jgi:DNA (cytosine-5)-methyltransferase 1
MLSGLDRSFIGGVERGQKNISLRNIGNIAVALGVTISDLFPERGRHRKDSEAKQPPAKKKTRATSSNRKRAGTLPTVGCLFAAIGGFASAFESVGAKARWANEHDPFACQTLRLNFPHVDCLEKDIHRLQARSLPPVDILTGGFPCQAFSQAGEREGFDDRRGRLFFEIVRLLKEWKEDRPSFVVLENVKHLLNHDRGRTFKVLASRLRQAGYWFGEEDYRVMDTSELTGIPQHRERLFMVAASTARFDSNPFQFPDRPKRTKTRPLRSFLDTATKAPDFFYFKPGDTYFPHFEKAITRGSKGSVYQLRRTYVRETKTRRCFTLTANMGEGGHNQPVIKDRWGYRKVMPHECLRLQGYPDDFMFPPDLSVSQRYKQVGNTVTVPLVAMIAERVLECLGAG